VRGVALILHHVFFNDAPGALIRHGGKGAFCPDHRANNEAGRSWSAIARRVSRYVRAFAGDAVQDHAATDVHPGGASVKTSVGAPLMSMTCRPS